MISLKSIYKTLFIGILAVAAVSCSDPWADRENNGDDNLDVNLTEAITANPEVSKFGELLTKTGYDKILAASKTYTVFVPTNEALAQLDPAISSNPEALSNFVANHIVLTSYSSVRNEAVVKLKMLSDKYLDFKGTNIISDATIVSPDHYAKNGIFHIINKNLTPKKNIWQYINAQKDASAMSKYLVSLNEVNIYPSDSIAKANTLPGQYADSLSNTFLKNVYNVNNEKQSYTMFLIEDDGYTTEVEKLKPYLNKSTVDATTTYSSYFTVRDMVFPKAYMPNELPATLTTRFGVEVPIDKTQIVGEPIVLSNGILYRMKKVDVPLTKRLVTTKIEGENNTSFFPTTLRSKLLYRDNHDPSDPLGVNFKDLIMRKPAVSAFWINYSAKDLYSTKYKVYWRAINDFQAITFQQRLIIGNVIRGTTYYPAEAIKAFDYTTVPLNSYTEVYLGEFSITKAGNIELISLISAATTADDVNSLALDYLKFVPVVK